MTKSSQTWFCFNHQETMRLDVKGLLNLTLFVWFINSVCVRVISTVYLTATDHHICIFTSEKICLINSQTIWIHSYSTFHLILHCNDLNIISNMSFDSLPVGNPLRDILLDNFSLIKTGDLKKKNAFLVYHIQCWLSHTVIENTHSPSKLATLKKKRKDFLLPC